MYIITPTGIFFNMPKVMFLYDFSHTEYRRTADHSNKIVIFHGSRNDAHAGITARRADGISAPLRLSLISS